MLEAPENDKDEFGNEDTEAVFEMMAEHVRIAASELIMKFFGERCRCEENCTCIACKKWRALDELLRPPFKNDNDTQIPPEIH